jgi:hypothetical protein
MLMATICGVEMGLAFCEIPHQTGGAARAMEFLKQAAGTQAGVRAPKGLAR